MTVAQSSSTLMKQVVSFGVQRVAQTEACWCDLHAWAVQMKWIVAHMNPMNRLTEEREHGEILVLHDEILVLLLLWKE